MLPSLLSLLSLLCLASAGALAAPPSGPHAVVTAGVGLPNLVHAHAEVFVADRWSVEAGGGTGLLPPTVTLGARYSPPGTCWGCWEGHGFRLSPGVTWYLFVTDPQEGLVTANLDLSWFWRSQSGWGVTAGARVGLGPSYGQVAGGTKIEPGGELIPLQVGIVR